MAFIATAAAIGAAGTIGGSMISARSQRKAAEEAREQQEGAIARLRSIREGLASDALRGEFLGRYGAADIFGTRMREANLSESIQRAAMANLENLPLTRRLIDRANRSISEESLARAMRFDPNFRQSLEGLSESARSLIRGEIPEDVRGGIQRARAEFAGGAGIPGTQRAATARDLGLTSLDLQTRGGSLFAQINAIREQVDPLSRQLGTKELMLSPSEQMQADIANRQIQAGADPIARSLFDLELEGEREIALAQKDLTIPVDNTLGAGLSAAGGAFSGLSQALTAKRGLDIAGQSLGGFGGFGGYSGIPYTAGGVPLYNPSVPTVPAVRV